MLQKSRVRFYLKKPGKGRASYSVLRDEVKPDGRRAQSIVRDERIDAVNIAFKNQTQSPAICEMQLQQVIESLYVPHRLAKAQFTEENRKLLERYWETEYADRTLADTDSAKNDLLRAIAAVGTLSLVSASKDQLQKEVDKKFKGNKQRRRVSRLNQLLKFAGRPIRLRRDKKEKRRVKYLSPEEFERVIRYISDPVEQMVVTVCYSVGCRIGEAFGLTTADYKSNVVHVDKQMKRDLQITDRKRGGECDSVPNPIGVVRLKEWLKFKDRETYRNRDWPEIVRTACQKAFPDDSSKWITTHGLRHSYAIWLLSKGVSLSLVAQSLGDSMAVVEEHYTGFVLTPESIEMIKSQLAK
jgi:integrase